MSHDQELWLCESARLCTCRSYGRAKVWQNAGFMVVHNTISRGWHTDMETENERMRTYRSNGNVFGGGCNEKG